MKVLSSSAVNRTPGRRRSRLLCASLGVAAALAAGAAPASAATLTLNSGTSAVGTPDAVQITFPGTHPATTIAGHAAWGNPLGASKWIGVSPTSAQSGPAGLTTYELPFTVPPSVGPITIAGSYMADNIGTAHLNGPVIASQSGCVVSNFQLPAKQFSSSAVNPGANTLKFIVDNCGGPTGLRFTATVTYTPAPPDLGLDHFKCYTVKPRDIKRRSVSLRDQFATRKSSVRQVKQLCNPVVKTHGKTTTPIRNPSAHLVCRRTVDSGKPVPTRFVRLRNQFGVQDARTTGAQTLCLPSLKRHIKKGSSSTPTGSNPERVLDHFRCYGLTPQKKLVGVTLRDQFVKGQAKVIELVRLCNPVQKTFKGKVTKIKRFEAHLACYRISDGASFKPLDVAVRNQFGIKRLRVLKAETLCLPTFKRVLDLHAEPELPPVSVVLPYTVGLTASACRGAQGFVHTVRGTTSPARPFGIATLVLRKLNAGSYPYQSEPKTVLLGADGTFAAETTTPVYPGTHSWTASVQDIDGATATAETSIVVDRPRDC